MSDLKFTNWKCTSPKRNWVKRMISANGTVDMCTWVALYRENLIDLDIGYDNLKDEEIERAYQNEDNFIWAVFFGDKLERFKESYEEMYGNYHKVSSKTAEEILSDIDSFLERVIKLNIFT